MNKLSLTGFMPIADARSWTCDFESDRAQFAFRTVVDAFLHPVTEDSCGEVAIGPVQLGIGLDKRINEVSGYGGRPDEVDYVVPPVPAVRHSITYTGELDDLGVTRQLVPNCENGVMAHNADRTKWWLLVGCIDSERFALNNYIQVAFDGQQLCGIAVHIPGYVSRKERPTWFSRLVGKSFWGPNGRS